MKTYSGVLFSIGDERGIEEGTYHLFQRLGGNGDCLSFVLVAEGTESSSDLINMLKTKVFLEVLKIGNRLLGSLWADEGEKITSARRVLPQVVDDCCWQKAAQGIGLTEICFSAEQ